MIPHFEAFHALTDGFNNTAPFMTQDTGEHTLRILARKRISIGMADTGSNDAYQDFTGLRRLYIYLHDLERLIRPKCYSCS